MTSSRRQVISRLAQAAFSIGSFLVIWELIARVEVVSTSLFPPPTRVYLALVEMTRSGELARDISASLWRAIVGLVAGSVVGVAAGMVTGRSKVLNNYLSPLIQLFRPLPPVAIIPLIIVWFGIGEPSKVFAIAFALFFPVWVNTHAGAKSIPHTFMWSAATLGVSGLEAIRRVVLPAALPFIVTGLRTGIATAFIMVFVSELAGASAGIGYQISVSYLAYRVDRMIAALIVLGLLGAATDVLLVKLLAFFLPWLKYPLQK